MSKLAALIFGALVSSTILADSPSTHPVQINQKEKMHELLKPYGKDGDAIYKGIIYLTERCNLQGQELTTLFYLGTQSEFDLTKAAFINAETDQEIKAAAKNIICPQ